MAAWDAPGSPPQSKDSDIPTIPGGGFLRVQDVGDASLAAQEGDQGRKEAVSATCRDVARGAGGVSRDTGRCGLVYWLYEPLQRQDKRRQRRGAAGCGTMKGVMA